MKTKLISILMVLCMTLPMFVSCGTAPVTNETDTEQAETAEPVTGLQIVKDGVSEYVIVRGENASPSDQTAAEQLQAYLQQITGAELPIVTDTVAAAEKEIIVGKTNRETEGEFVREELNEDGFVIKTTGEKLYIVGTEERGTLFGVFDFLERYLGCRFYTADVEKVPEMKTISLEPIEEDKQIPVFMYRDMGWWDYKISELFCAKRKVYITAGGGKRELNPAYGEYKGWVGGTDNVSRLITPAEYYAEHPEYFALVDGVRMETDAGGGPQLCLSNPEVIQLLTEKVREKLQAGMDKWGMYTVTQMDNNNPCTCDNCMAIYEEEGGASSDYILKDVYEEYDEDAPVTSETTYDTLMNEYVELETEKQKLEVDLEHKKKMLAVFTEGTGSEDKSNTATIEESLEELSKNLDEMYTTVSATVEEYNQYVGAYNVSTLASITTTEKINVKMYILLAIIIFFFGGCIGAIILGRSKEFLDYIMYVDRKTGLPNRAMCDIEIEKYAAEKLKDNFAFVLIKLDNLKYVNEKGGREAGDALLKAFGKILKRAASSYGFVGYNGSEQFIGLFEECTPQRANDFRQYLEELVRYHNVQLPNVTIHVSSAYSETNEEQIYDVRKLMGATFRKISTNTAPAKDEKKAEAKTENN